MNCYFDLVLMSLGPELCGTVCCVICMCRLFCSG